MGANAGRDQKAATIFLSNVCKGLLSNFLFQADEPMRKLHRRSRRTTILRLERLETRNLLAAFVWNTDSDGNWNDAANWIDGDGNTGVPGDGDDVTIERFDTNPVVTISSDAHAESLNSTEQIVVDGAALHVDTTAHLDSVTLSSTDTSAGELRLIGSATVNGELRWDSGNLYPQDLTLGVGATFTIPVSPFDKRFSGVLRNAGTVNQEESFQTPFHNSRITNLATGQWVTSSSVKQAGGSGMAFINEGVFRKTGAGTAAFPETSDTFRHVAGSQVIAEEGTLGLPGGGTQADPSTGAEFVVSEDAIVELHLGTSVMNGMYVGTGDGRVRFASGTLDARFGDATFDFEEELFHWTGGVFQSNEIDVSGVINVGHITLSGSANRKLLGKDFQNRGTIVKTDDGTFQIDIGSRFTNTVDAVFDNRGTGSVFGGGPFINNGVVRSSSDCDFNIDLSANEGSVLDVSAGTTLLSYGGFFETSTLNVAADAEIEFAEQPGGSFFHLVDAATITGVGEGRVEFSEGRIDADESNAVLDFAPGMFHWTGGQLRNVTTVGDMTIGGGDGTPSVYGTFTNTGTVTQRGGSSLQVNKIVNADGGTWEVQDDAGFQPYSGWDRFENYGLLTKTGAGTVMIGDGSRGVLFVHHGGTIDVQAGDLSLDHLGDFKSTDSHFIIAAGSTVTLTGTLTSSGSFTGEGDGHLMINSKTRGDGWFVLDFPEDFASFGAINTAHHFLENRGFLTLPDIEGWHTFGWFRNDGTLVQTPGSDVLLENYSFVTNDGLWELQEDTTISLRTFDRQEAFVSNFGTLRKTGAGTATILHGPGWNTPGGGIPHLNNSGTIEVAEGVLEIDSRSIEQLDESDQTLHGGKWQVGPAATLRFFDSEGNEPPIMVNYADISLVGSESAFPNISPLEVNGGRFEITDGRDFDAVGNWTNGVVRVDLQMTDVMTTSTNRFVGIAVSGGRLITHNRNVRIDNQTVFHVRDLSGRVTDLIVQPGGAVEISGIDVTSTQINVGGTNVPAGSLLFIHGEEAPPTLYAISLDSGDVLASVQLADVSQDQAGVAMHPSRGTVFVVGRNNRITEVDASSGSVLNSFHVRPPDSPSFGFGGWGGIDVAADGTLLVTGSQRQLRGLSPLGEYIGDIDLSHLGIARQTVSDLSVDDVTGDVWVSVEEGFMYRFAASDVSAFGELRVGSGSTLSVAGDYTQTDNVIFGFGGDVASGQFGSIEIEGTAELAGAVSFELDDGFFPGAGQVYDVMTFASKTGELTFGGDLDSFDPILSDIVLRANSLVGAADLAIDSVTVPESGIAGDDITISYRGRNLTGGPTADAWTDSVYLSADSHLDPNDLLIGRVSHSGDVGGGGTYTESMTAALPGSLPANYHVIVVADSRGNSPDKGRDNNIGASTDTISLDIPALTPDVRFDGNLGADQAFYFRVDLSTDAAPLIKANFSQPGAAELFVRQGQFPTRNEHDHYGYSSQDQSITITQPAGRFGTFFLLVRGIGDTAFSLLASNEPFGLTRLGTRRGANSGQVSTIVTGKLFNSQTTFALRSEGQSIDPVSTDIIDSETAWLTFDLTGVNTGTYDFEASDGESSDLLPQAFEVVEGNAGQLEFDISVPAFVRAPFRSAVAVLTYENVGETDLIAPIFTVATNNARLRLPEQSTWSVGSIEVLGINPDGPADVLPPGAQGSVEIRYEPLDTTQGASSEFEVRLASVSEVPDGEPEIDWDLLKDDLRPIAVNPLAWDAIYSNFKSAVGDSYDLFQRRMADNARYLASIGLPTSDIARLMSWEFEKAGNFGQIERNYFRGVLGQQPFPILESQATVDSNGSVTVSYGSEIRGFVLTDRGYVPAGNHGISEIDVADDGTITLTEPDGARATFRESDGRLVEIFDPREGVTAITIDASGLATQITEPNGDATLFDYNSDGQIRQITDAVGRVTTLAYDSDGLLESITELSGTIRFVHHGLDLGTIGGAVQSVTFQDGTSREYGYDDLGRITSISTISTSETRIDTTYTYTADGVVTSTDENGNQVVRHLAPGGLVAATLDPLGHLRRTQLSNTSLPASIIDTDGATATFDYGNDFLIDSVVDVGGNSIVFDYEQEDQFVRLSAITDSLGSKTSFWYDATSNLTDIINPDGSQHTARYDSNGNLTHEITASGETFVYTYDEKNLQRSKQFTDGTAIIYEYDDHRNLISASRRDASNNDIGTTSFTYDDSDRVLSATYPNGTSLNFTYDAIGRRTSATDHTGSSIEYRYDAFGKLGEVLDNSNGTPRPLVTYSYDAIGRLEFEIRGNGTITQYIYDASNRVVGITHSDDSGNLEDLTYVYNQAGRVTRVTTIDGDTDYEYDIHGQLTKATLPGGRVFSYQYDSDGNRTQVNDDGRLTQWSVNPMNQYESIGSAELSYDGNGSLTDNGGEISYRYDVEGRLISITEGEHTVEYEYDALGNQIARIEAGERTDLLVDPIGLTWLFGEYASTGTQAIYARGNGIAARLGSEDTQFYHFDLIGNTRFLTNSAAAVSDRYEYLPFGELQSHTGTTANPFTFNGNDGILNGGIGDNYFMRERNYSAELGRFLEVDPIGHQSGETNLYRFAANDPVSGNDPSGLLFEGLATTTIPGAGQLELIVEVGGARHHAFLESLIRSTGQPRQVLPRFRPSHQRFTGHLVRTFNNGTLSGQINSLRGARAAGAVGLAFAGGWIAGRGIDNATDYYYPEAKNEFRDTLLRFQGLADPNSPLYDKGGIHDTRYNDFVRKNMADPLINSVAKRLIEQGNEPREAIEKAVRLVNNCRRAGECDPPKKKKSEVVRPRDPNNIVGPAGARADAPGDPEVQRVRFDGFVRPSGFYQYDIHFENKSSATAPAQNVIVTHTIDEDLDLSTFQLTSFGFGETVVAVPDGRANYFERVDVSDTLNVVVDFESVLDLETRQLTVMFTSLDPQTLDFPSDPFAGFLPPNVTAPEGDGFIKFTIEPEDDLAEGTRIDAVARIVFDTEEHIDTPDVSNLIDVSPPNSQIDSLPARVPTTFDVSWTGDDLDGAGIQSYDVFVSENGGPFELWLDDTVDTSAGFTGTDGSSYSFYSVATDNLGYVETVDGTADTATTIVSSPWTNPDNIYDVDTRGGATALDALLIINELGRRLVSDPVTQDLVAVPPAGFSPPYYDVSMDGKATALDALLVINEIARTRPESLTIPEGSLPLAPDRAGQQIQTEVANHQSVLSKKSANLVTVEVHSQSPQAGFDSSPSQNSSSPIEPSQETDLEYVIDLIANDISL